MKKILILIMLLVLMPVFVHADISVENISLKNTAAYPSDMVNIKIDGNLSENIKAMSAGLYSENEKFVNYQIDIENVSNPYFIVPSDLEPGKYTLAYVLIETDNKTYTFYNKSLKSYFGNDKYNYMSFSTDILDIIGTNENSFSSQLSHIYFEKSIIGQNEENKIYVSTLNNDNVSNISLVINNEKNTYNVNLSYDNINNVFIGNYKAENIGEHYISSLSITDKNGKKISYSYEKNNNDILLDKKYSFNVNIVDSNIITLESIKLNKIEVPTNGNFKIYALINSKNPIKKVEATFISSSLFESNKVSTKESGEIKVDLTYDTLSKKYSSLVSLNNLKKDIYILEKLEIIDDKNNSVLYLNKNLTTAQSSGNLKNIVTNLDISFEIKDMEYDFTVNSLDDIDLINNLKSNANIFYNASVNPVVPSSLFKSIKGTNRTLYIKYYDFIWVFKGIDIVNEKDTDLALKLELYENNAVDNSDKSYVSIIFNKNEKLPGVGSLKINLENTFKYEEGISNINVYTLDKDKYNKSNKIINLTNDGYYELNLNEKEELLLSDKEMTIKNKINVSRIILYTVLLLVFSVIAVLIIKINKEKSEVN